MIFLLIFITPVTLHLLFVKKIHNKTYKICMNFLNSILTFGFIVLFISLEFSSNHLSSYIDFRIEEIENTVNEIYPNAFEKQIDLEEIKNIFEESFAQNDACGIEFFAENIIKSKALKAINLLERENNKLSIKDALISIKELSLNAINPYIRLAKIVLVALYFILMVASICITKHLINDKDENNEGIIFGEEADKTFIGMKTE